MIIRAREEANGRDSFCKYRTRLILRWRHLEVTFPIVRFLKHFINKKFFSSNQLNSQIYVRLSSHLTRTNYLVRSKFFALSLVVNDSCQCHLDLSALQQPTWPMFMSSLQTRGRGLQASSDSRLRRPHVPHKRWRHERADDDVTERTKREQWAMPEVSRQPHEDILFASARLNVRIDQRHF